MTATAIPTTITYAFEEALERSKTLEQIRIDALFASYLQRSEASTDDSVREAVTATLRRLGNQGCAALVAQEFGEHPETAVGRMRWALATVRQAYALG